MKKTVLNRSVGIATIALLAGLGISGCSSSSEESPKAEATATASPIASEAPLPDPSSEPTTSVVSKQTEVVDTINGFFITIDMETRAGAERLTGESVTADVIKEIFPGTLSYISSELSEEKAFEMISLFSSLSSSPESFTVTVPEEGIVIDGDTATISGEKLVLESNGEVLPKPDNASETSGSFKLNRIDGGKWEISDFEMGTGAAEPTK